MIPSPNTNARASHGACRATLALMLCCGLAFMPQNLKAHATLVHMQPDAGARLNQPPAQIILVFNERIESVFHALRVVNSQGGELETGEIRVVDGGETLSATLPPMPAGPYAVYWKINSLDGHQVQGQFGFGLQSEPPNEQNLVDWTPVTAPSVPPWLFPLLKGLHLIALAAWLGGLFAWIFVFLPHQRPEFSLWRNAFATRSRRVILFSAAAVLFIELTSLTAKTASFTGGPIRSALAAAPLSAVLTGSSFGLWWTIRFAAAALLLAFTAWATKTSASTSASTPAFRAGNALLGGVLSTAIFITIAATGHALAAGEMTLLAQAMHGIHLCASTLWVGGLMHMLIAVSQADVEQANAALWLEQIASRFSRVAQIFVAALFLTGIYNTWLHVPAWSSFLDSAYGRVLTTKLVWVLITLGVASVNWKRVLPELARFRQNPATALRWIPRFESLLMAEVAGSLVILGAVALLTNMPPASASAQGGARELRQQAGGYTISLRLDPAKLGRNVARIALNDGTGTVRSDARRITVFLKSLDMDMGLASAPAVPQPDGSYQAEVVISMAGRWSISVEVAPAEGDAFVAEFHAEI
ncbi:MAG: hypothetical protein EXQ56_06615 [Acidobacteria bacterium]|nr:hypothetical protein [Acidobacteriota bacterium]